MKIKLDEKWLIPIFISIAVLRYLPNLLDANLYAEDGTVFLRDYISSGYTSFNNLFNGYPVLGLYLLTALASSAHSISGLPGYTIPTFIALVSFTYWGLLSYSPIYFLKGLVARRNLIVLAFAILLMPFGSYDYAILGTIGNLKFSFLPLSFFIAIHLSSRTGNSKSGFSFDCALLVICILTNPLSILSLSVLIPLYVKSILCHEWFKFIWINTFIIISTITFFNALTNSTKIPGYLDSPFQLKKAIEIFVGQTLLYPPLHSIYTHLNDFTSLIGALLIISFMIKQSSRDYYLPLVTLLIAVLASIVFVWQRPGVSEYFFGYTLRSPSQFFYSQNILVITSIFLAIEKVKFQSNKIESSRMRFYIAITLLISQILPTTPIGTFGINAPMQSKIKSAIESATVICAGKETILKVPIYPNEIWVFSTTKDYWCF